MLKKTKKDELIIRLIRKENEHRQILAINLKMILNDLVSYSDLQTVLRNVADNKNESFCDLQLIYDTLIQMNEEINVSINNKGNEKVRNIILEHINRNNLTLKQLFQKVDCDNRGFIIIEQLNKLVNQLSAEDVDGIEDID